MLTARAAAPYFIFHQPNSGTVARYHLDAAMIDAQLADLRAATDGISLSIWLCKGVGAHDYFLDWANGQLAPQPLANLANLLASIKRHGFNWVQIAPQFYGPNDCRTNPFTEAMYQENWIFLASLPGMCDAAGLEYLIDVCLEVNNVYKTNENLRAYARRLWVDVTSWFYPGGVPSWNFSMSTDPGCPIDAMVDVFQGNPPAILLPHCYSTDPSMTGALENMRKGLPASWTQPWILGETDTLLAGDEAIAGEVADFVKRTRQPILRVCPWPVTPASAPEITIDVVPAALPAVWRGIGA